MNQDYLWSANYLFNLQLLQGDENINKRAKDPEVWMSEELITTERIAEYKLKNYIKEDLDLEWENIAEKIPNKSAK